MKRIGSKRRTFLCGFERAKVSPGACLASPDRPVVNELKGPRPSFAASVKPPLRPFSGWHRIISSQRD